jgi:peptidoglycan/xylan/chitin deacetylase (PgdA/CDA1 family)
MERLSPDDVKKEVMALDDQMKKMIGKKTKYFRFPGGNYDAKTLKLIEDMNYKVVHWTFPSGDPDKHVTAPKLRSWVVSKARPGNVLIFHINGRGYSTGEALPQIVNDLRKKGIKFVKLEDAGI